MRLIDADKVRTFDSINKGNFNSVDTIQRWIDSAETVKAIPIEWLKKKYNEADDMGLGIEDWSIKDCYGEVLAQWEKENE